MNKVLSSSSETKLLLLPGKSEVIGHVPSGPVGVVLVEPEVGPGDEDARREHDGCRTVEGADDVEEEGDEDEAEGDVAVGELPQAGAPHDDVVGHDLLHGHREPRDEPRQPVDVHLEQQPRRLMLTVLDRTFQRFNKIIKKI